MKSNSLPMNRAIAALSGVLALACTLGFRPPPGPPADPVIAFSTSTSELRVMNADGSNIALIYKGPAAYSAMPPFSWSPDGGSIAFCDPFYGLYRIDVTIVSGFPTGTNLVLLAPDPGQGVTYQAPAWSPLGDEIVFNDFGTGVLLAVPAAGGAVQTIYTPPEGYFAEGPAWRSDGAYLAFRLRRYGQETGHTIQILERATGLTTTALDSAPDGMLDIDWARTRDTLAFNGPGGVCLLDLAPGATPQLLRANAGSPTWSPDDSQLLFVNTKTGKLQRMTLATGAVTTFGKGGSPDWRR